MNINLEILAHTLEIVGSVMIAYTVLTVHGRVQKEQRIDESVFHAMKREKFIGMTGVVLMVCGYFLYLFIKL